MAITFTSTLEIIQGVPLLRLPKEASALLPTRGMAMAEGAIGGATFALPLEPDGLGGHFIPLPPEAFAAAGIQEGESLRLQLTPTDKWPEPPVPAQWRQALEEAGLIDRWENITVKARWEWLRWIRAAMSPVTRDKRVAVGISKLQSGMNRPCCFNAASCTLPEVSRGGKLLK